jgi:cytochrome bd-type quinol oxidase subunit 2
VLHLVVLIIIIAIVLWLCHLVGTIARRKERNYWLFFVAALLFFLPALLIALIIPRKRPVAS